MRIVMMLTGLLYALSARADGIWSITGQIPSAGVGASRNIWSPDALRFVRGTPEGLRLGEKNSPSVQTLQTAAMPPLWEVVWSPDSKRFAVNLSDGGAVGTWDADIFDIDATGHARALGISELIRHAAKALPLCLSPEHVNVAVLGWDADGDVVFLVAEVPPHSSCQNMGALQGFKVALPSKKILDVVPEPALRHRWRHLFGTRLSGQQASVR